jgi:hypothetical protein
MTPRERLLAAAADLDESQLRLVVQFAEAIGRRHRPVTDRDEAVTSRDAAVRVNHRPAPRPRRGGTSDAT